MVPQSLNGERLDRALAALALCASRREAREALQRGSVFVGASRVRVASRLVCAGDHLRVEAAGPPVPLPPVQILWESGALLALNKPGGVPLAPTRSAVEGCLLQAFARARKLPLKAVHPLHRLDTPTSGVVLVALDATTAGQLGRAFQERAVQKTYLAWIHGRPEETAGVWEWPLSKPRNGYVSVDASGVVARTRFQVLWSEAGQSLLALSPETGRTHQLRVHCAKAGCPIVGDRKYGRGADAVGRALLHAWKLVFTWKGKRHEVTAPPPPDMGRGLSQVKWAGILTAAQPPGRDEV